MPIALRSAICLFVFVALPVRAQPPPGPPMHVERRVVPLAPAGCGAGARLVSTWAPTEAASGLVLTLGAQPAVPLVRGSAPGAIESVGGLAVVAYEVGGTARPFRVRVARNDGAAILLGEERALARPGARADDIPFAVAIAPVADGFAVFFQEVQSDDPTAARTYMFRVDREGVPDTGREVPVPWPIAAAAWNGQGFHLALLYSGGGDGIRLSMVSLTADGQPQQHPDWSSAPGDLSDVHLVVSDGRVRAFYRGGGGGDRFLESDVTTVRGWGSAPPHAHDHGVLARDAALCISPDGSPVAVPP